MSINLLNKMQTDSLKKQELDFIEKVNKIHTNYIKRTNCYDPAVIICIQELAKALQDFENGTKVIPFARNNFLFELRERSR